MAFPLYRCDDEFPERILGVLKELGFVPETVPEPENKLSQSPKSFSFRVKRGLARVRVSGSQENGQMACFIVLDTPANPLSWRPSVKLSREIEQIMLQHGAQPIEQDEPD